MIDDHIVITGSVNFTKAAQEINAENVLIISNNELTQEYMINWEFRKSKSYKSNVFAAVK